MFILFQLVIAQVSNYDKICCRVTLFWVISYGWIIWLSQNLLEDKVLIGNSWILWCLLSRKHGNNNLGMQNPLTLIYPPHINLRMVLQFWYPRIDSWYYAFISNIGVHQSPTSGAHAHGFWVGMGGHRFVHPCIRLQIRVKFLGCKEYSNQEALQTEGNDNERPFICPIQPRLGVGGWYTLHNFWIHGRNLNSMGGHMSCYGWAWVGIGRCWWSWSGYGYKFEGKCWALVCTSSLIPLINEKRHQILKATWCCEYPEERRKPRDLLARWSRLRGVPNSAVYNQFLRFVVVQNLLGFMLQGIQGSWLWGFSVTFFQGSWNQARAVIRVRISDSAIATLSHLSALWSRGSCAHRLSDWVMRSK
jgi:hypothetical protein